MGRAELRAQVLDALRQVAPETEAEAIDPAVSFRDQLGIDSVDFLNFVVALEEMLGIRIAEVDQLCLSSLDGCLTYLAGLSTRPGAHPET